MSNSKPTEERTVESTDDHHDDALATHDDALATDGDALATDGGISPEVLADSLRNKTAALAEQGEDLADDLDRLAEAKVDADADADELDPAFMMTELLETASDLVAVAHQIEEARAQQ